MRILVLGGTSFVGRAIVADALAHDHDVTLFNRGRTGPDLFPAAQRRVGDRDAGDYSSLAGGAWDVVVDVNAYIPRHVGQAADAVGDVGRYLFISTGSVYDPKAISRGATEDAKRLPPERGTEEVTDTTYGGLKVACEDDVLSRYGQRATIVRPGVVAGPHDPTDRFTWWVRRVARGERIEVPRPDQPVQVIDAGDLARLVVTLLADDRPGIFNAKGLAQTLAGLAAACAAAAGSTVDLVPNEQAKPLPPLVFDDPSWDAMFTIDSSKARASGMPSTPLESTAAATLDWDRERGEPPLSTD